jgi:mycothiol S-conjugate amidase
VSDRRLLFVHAHPDDESSKGAATAARYVDEGAQVVLVTCTGGEAGEILNKAMKDTPIAEIPAVRAAELAAAVRAIGFTRAHTLGEHDSGWHEDLAQVPQDGCFWHAPIDRPAGRLAAILREERPQVVVTYPPDGGYPHPDHIRTHEVTVRAVELAADPGADVPGEPWQVARVLGCTVFTQPRLLALHAAMLEAGLESPYEEWLNPPEGEEPRPVRDADRLPVAVQLDVAEWFPRRDTALLAHATQVDPEGGWFAMPRDVEAVAWPYEVYVPVLPAELPGMPLDDLFAGL